VKPGKRPDDVVDIEEYLADLDADEERKARRKAAEEALDNFNYVGSRWHY
jgi:hypothetical protein